MNFLKYIAKTWRINQHPLGEKGTQILLHHFPKKSIKILEIGCGTGHTAAIISNNNKNKYFGIDKSKWMTHAAEKRIYNLAITNCSFMFNKNDKYDFEDDFFDVVFCESVLAIQSLKEFDIIMKEIYRVLKKGGLFLANESIWKENISTNTINGINNTMFSKFGLIQAGKENNKKNWEKLLVKCKFDIKQFKLLSSSNETENFNTNTNYHNSKKYTLLKKRMSFLNPKYLFQFIYFKILEIKFKKIGIYIESYIIICEK